MSASVPLSDATRRFARAWIKAEVTELWANPVKYVVSEDVTLEEAIRQLQLLCEDLDVSFTDLVAEQPQGNQYAMGLLRNVPSNKSAVQPPKVVIGE
jgi:hypothetical protein